MTFDLVELLLHNDRANERFDVLRENDGTYFDVIDWHIGSSDVTDLDRFLRYVVFVLSPSLNSRSRNTSENVRKD